MIICNYFLDYERSEISNSKDMKETMIMWSKRGKFFFHRSFSTCSFHTIFLTRMILKRQTLLFEEPAESKPNPTFVPPNISLEKLRKAIPSHCFSRPLWKSLLYLAYNVSLILILGLVFNEKIGFSGTSFYHHFLHYFYSFVQGLFFTVVIH